MKEANIGIDISKDHLAANRFPSNERRRFDNPKADHKRLIRRIGETPVRVIDEPTGRYHCTLERALAAAGMPIPQKRQRCYRAVTRGAARNYAHPPRPRPQQSADHPCRTAARRASRVGKVRQSFSPHLA